MASSSQRDEYQQHLYEHVIVKRTRLATSCGERREWSLVSKRHIPVGAFIGFYTGSFVGSLATDQPSLYALELGPRQPTILPFPDEACVCPHEREAHPLACANEPAESRHANAHLEVADFSRQEVERVETLHNHELARFFRGLAMYACADIRVGEQITWHYGASYEPNRRRMGYSAGRPCKRVIERVPFVEPNSAAVLEALPKVPSYCLYPVISCTIRSDRFRMKRPARVDSEGEESVASSSGSGHEPAYKPRPSSRRRSGTSA